MYLASILALLLVLPVISILIELIAHTNADLVFLIGKWFVFWAVGIRLLLAGIRQMANPSFTADTIFQIKDKAAEKIVQELGFGNFALGILGVLTIPFPTWIAPAALAGGLYYGLAGAKHAMNSGRNAKQNVAMVSDIAIFALLAIWLAVAFHSGHLAA